ncbi:MAG: glycosyltransferase [Acidobacteria bacterium]|nr:glycosyltransferase [Acidobacteriota bacterium]
MHRQAQRHRICFLTTGLARGGAEIQVVLLARGFKQRGWDVSVESMLPPQDFVEELTAHGIPVTSLGMERGVPNPLAIWRLTRRWRKIQPDVVHCHMVHANLLGRITRIFAPPRVLIATAHNIWEGPKWRDWAYRLTDGLGDLTTNVSQAALDRYVKDKLVRREKAVYMPNGIETSRFAPNEDLRKSKRHELGWGSNFVWLAVGNLRVQKDYPNLIAAFGQHRCKQKGVRLAIAGYGELQATLKEQIRQLQLDHCVELLGARGDVRELMLAADGFVMSSAWEGLPLVLIEASASGLPIVATNVGGNGEIVAGGQTGFLVPPKDSAALASGMDRMIALDVSRRKEMGVAGLQRAEQYYGIESVLSKWENIYDQLLQVNAPRRRTRWTGVCSLPEGVRQWRQG